jgi:hypothetical protein
MGWHKIKLDPADIVFSQWVRLNSMQCVRCHSTVKLNNKGLPISHQASHYFGRGRENTRFEPDNVDCLCGGCHQIWGSTDREAYRVFKLKQLGQKRYDSLTVQANTYCKKDRELMKIVWREKLKEYLEKG